MAWHQLTCLYRQVPPLPPCHFLFYMLNIVTGAWGYQVWCYPDYQARAKTVIAQKWVSRSLISLEVSSALLHTDGAFKLNSLISLLLPVYSESFSTSQPTLIRLSLLQNEDTSSVSEGLWVQNTFIISNKGQVAVLFTFNDPFSIPGFNTEVLLFIHVVIGLCTPTLLLVPLVNVVIPKSLSHCTKGLLICLYQHCP